MADKIHEITAGRHSVFEIVEHDDGNFTIRETQHPERSITLPTSTRTVLINILQGLKE